MRRGVPETRYGEVRYKLSVVQIYRFFSEFRAGYFYPFLFLFGLAELVGYRYLMCAFGSSCQLGNSDIITITDIEPCRACTKDHSQGIPVTIARLIMLGRQATIPEPEIEDPMRVVQADVELVKFSLSPVIDSR